MRILRVQFQNVGGLSDGGVDLPDKDVVALAGANGTGKSKLLAAMLTPWYSSGLPSPADPDEAVRVTVRVGIDESEVAALSRLSEQEGWGAIPRDTREFDIVTTRQPLTNSISSLSEPQMTVLQGFHHNEEFLSRYPSLALTFVPAERRLLQRGGTGVDLEKLSDMLGWRTQHEAYSALENQGRLDDGEFEDFATALCVADWLPSESGDVRGSSDERVTWAELAESVNELLAPKVLLPLTREHPSKLRVLTQSGSTHGIEDLSSGERQALVIVSRVLRKRAKGGVVIIDEPDAFLHPQLSRRMIRALQRAVGSSGQLIVATHSPAILDELSPESIFRLGYLQAPRLVADETDRLDLYRSAGFRASAVTQSDLLILTEGESDVHLLSLMFPELTRASMRSAGGRAQVLKDLGRLQHFDLPVMGVVDHDIHPPQPQDNLVVWPAADIEALFLRDDSTLEMMVGLGLARADFNSRDALRHLLNRMVSSSRQRVVAEMAQTSLRGSPSMNWPSPKTVNPLDALRDAVRAASWPTVEAVDAAIRVAEATWEEYLADPWVIVRGKFLLQSFAQEASLVPRGSDLLDVLIRNGLRPSGLEEFGQVAGRLLAGAGSE